MLSALLTPCTVCVPQVIYAKVLKQTAPGVEVDETVAVGVADGPAVGWGYRTTDGAGSAYPKRPLKKIQFVGFNLPVFSEEVDTPKWQDYAEWLEKQLASWLLDERMPFFDEVESPRFFESNYEAAVYYFAALKPHLPRAIDLNYSSLTLNSGARGNHHSELVGMIFGGLGQWFVKAVQRDESGGASWAEREASGACVPPSDAIFVVDLSSMAGYEVREGYERYGACVFLDQAPSVLGIWIEAEGRMVTPAESSRAAWDYALWRAKVSLYFLSFVPTHLVCCHWIVSNTLVQAVRETLHPPHAVRCLMWPFTHGTITLNYAAAVQLASVRGAVPRVGALTGAEVHKLMGAVASKFRYESFPAFIERKGRFSPEAERRAAHRALPTRREHHSPSVHWSASVHCVCHRSRGGKTRGSARSPPSCAAPTCAMAGSRRRCPSTGGRCGV